MDNVWKIIQFCGGLDALKVCYIRLENPGYMPLVIEHIGSGPRDLPMISVAHYYKQNGDPMRDPEMTFEVNDQSGARVPYFLPVMYQQDGVSLYQEAVYRDGDKIMVRPRLVKDLGSFARMWDRNIGEQGFVEIARTRFSEIHAASQAQNALPLP
ncbi:hypothetical protein ANRL1_00854 [Anaerolineae bacterium]|nr:hypothetical protein ANRL1_00854 [Anaerolineae bacterium]